MKSIVQNMHKAILLMVIALLGSTSLFALTPPVNIGHTVKSQNPLKVELWFIVDSRDVDAIEYAVYQASGQTEDMSQFTKIGTVQKTNKEKYYYTVDNLAPGSYTFFVKSVDQAGVESDRSMITVVKQKNEDNSKIKIEGNIPGFLCIGENLRIEFTAMLANTEASQFNYELLDAPDGMTISESGVLEWNGSANVNATMISFAVRVSVEGNPNATNVKQVAIKIKNCDETPKDELYINEPPRKACVGKEYRYEIGGKYKGTRENVTIRYTVISGPLSISVDEPGVGIFSPSEVGDVRIVLLVEAVGEGIVITRREVVIELRVTNCDEDDKEEKAGLRFVSSPRKEICLLNDRQENAVYRYESRALISKEAQGNVTYALLQGPDGMTISSNGVVEWPVSGAGEYEVVIEATTTLEDGTSLRTEQRFVLRVIDCNEERPKDLGCAIIEGNVWSNGNAIGGEGAVVSLFRTDVLDANGNELKNIERLYRAKVMNGRYEVKVPNGSYKLRIEGGGVIPEWFENVTEGDAATVVSVNCDETRAVNFDVERREEAAPMTINGRVIDAATGAGVSGVKVVVRANTSDHKNGNAVQRFFATTGNDGNYVLTAPSHQSYIAYVEAQGYMVQYFDGVTDATGATPINNENVGQINFALTPQAGMVQGISGTIVDETGAGIVGKVVAYQVADANGTKPNNDNRAAYTVETDNIGNYSFRAMLPGNYVFMAYPMDREFVPGYYNSNSSELTTDWQNATVVEVGEVMPTVQYNILVGIRKGEKGLAKLRGHVRAGKNAGILVPSINELQTVFGAVITVFDDNKEVSSVGVSNFDGTFEVNELSIGTFNFVAQKVGYYPESGTISMDAAGNITVDQDIELQPISFTSVQESEESLLSIYPNPAINKSTVQFVGNGAASTIAVYNTMGVQVMTMNVPTTLGSTTVQFSVANLATGIYTVKVSNGSFVQTTQMSVVR
jgi:protocatechuate 3,4-dioxygenase beta subunit